MLINIRVVSQQFEDYLEESHSHIVQIETCGRGRVGGPQPRTFSLSYKYHRYRLT